MSDKEITQQQFLNDAMKEMNFTREQFADWLGVPKRRLLNWLHDKNSDEHRAIDPIVKKWLPVLVGFEMLHRMSIKNTQLENVSLKSLNECAIVDSKDKGNLKVK